MDMSAGTRVAVTAGHRHAALCPPRHGWQPLITGVLWACQRDHTERRVSYSAEKVSKPFAISILCVEYLWPKHAFLFYSNPVSRQFVALP